MTNSRGLSTYVLIDASDVVIDEMKASELSAAQSQWATDASEDCRIALVMSIARPVTDVRWDKV